VVGDRPGERPDMLQAPWTIRDSVGEGELEDLLIGRDGRDLGDPRRDAVSDDLDPGSDLRSLALATKQRQLELPSVAYGL